MTKQELIREIKSRTHYDNAVIEEIIDSFTCVVREVSAEDAVIIRGFGAFTKKTRKEKVARHLTENRPIIVPEHDIPYFKPYFNI